MHDRSKKSGSSQRPDDGMPIPSANPLLTEWLNSTEGIFWTVDEDGTVHKQYFNVYESIKEYDSADELLDNKYGLVNGEDGFRWGVWNSELNRMLTSGSGSSLWSNKRTAREVKDNEFGGGDHLKVVQVFIE